MKNFFHFFTFLVMLLTINIYATTTQESSDKGLMQNLSKMKRKDAIDSLEKFILVKKKLAKEDVYYNSGHRNNFNFWEQNKSRLNKTLNDLKMGKPLKTRVPLKLSQNQLEQRFRLFVQANCPCLKPCTKQIKIEQSWCYVSQNKKLSETCEKIRGPQGDHKYFRVYQSSALRRYRWVRRCDPDIDR